MSSYKKVELQLEEIKNERRNGQQTVALQF